MFVRTLADGRCRGLQKDVYVRGGGLAGQRPFAQAARDKTSTVLLCDLLGILVSRKHIPRRDKNQGNTIKKGI